MPKLTMSTELPASVETVWSLIGGFNALPDWHPGISKLELSDGGSKRTLEVSGVGSVVERLENTAEGHRYSYSVLQSPLPVKNYTAAICVKPGADSSSCTVEWSGDFQAADVPENEATRIIQGIYQVGFDNLKRMFGV
jgi:hypothetical protein